MYNASSSFRKHVSRQIDQILGTTLDAFNHSALNENDFARATMGLSPHQLLDLVGEMAMGVDYGQTQNFVTVLGTLPSLGPDTRVVLHAETIEEHQVDGVLQRIIHRAHDFEPDLIRDDANGLGYDRHIRLAEHCHTCPVLPAFFLTTPSIAPSADGAKQKGPDEAVHIEKPGAVRRLIKSVRSGTLLIPDALSERATLQHHLTALAVHGEQKGIRQIHQPAVTYLHADDHFMCSCVYADSGLWRLRYAA